MDRYRSRNNDFSTLGYYQSKLYNADGTLNHDYGYKQSMTNHRLFDEMWDVDDPNWKETLYQWVRYKKSLPVNPMLQKKEILKQSAVSGHWRSTPGWAGRYTMNHYRGFPTFFSGYAPIYQSGSSLYRTFMDPNQRLELSWPSEFTASHRASVLQTALAKARTASWDVGTFIAEFNKTQRMVASAGKNFESRVKKIMSRGNIKTLEQFSSAWLEYRYGWRILALDILEANESFLRLQGINPLLGRYTSFDSKSLSSTKMGPMREVQLLAPGTGIQTRVNGIPIGSLTKTRELRAGVGLEASLESLGFFDPLNTMIEITPYALVANWFFNIKDLIAAWSPFARGSISYGFVTAIDREEMVLNWTSLQPGFQCESYRIELPESRYILETRHRVPATPTLNLRFRVDLNPGRIVDGIAIALVAHSGLLKSLRLR